MSSQFSNGEELCFSKTKLSKVSEYVIQIEEFNSEWVFFFFENFIINIGEH